MAKHQRIQPAIYPINPGTIAPVKKVFLQNRIPVFLIEAGTEDIMRVEFVFKAGQVKENIPLVASSTNMMLTEGTEEYESEEINRLLDYYGVFLHMSAEKDTAGMVTYFQNKHIEKVFELASQILFRPVFPEKEFSVLMKKRLRWYLVSREKIQNLATDRFFESVFGTHHPYGKKVSEKDYESVNTKQLREFHHNYYTPGNLTIIISGKIEKNTVELLEKYLGGLLQENFYNIDNVLNMSGEANRREHIKKRGTLQSSVRIGSSTINKRHPDYPGLKVLNSVLGGYFGSRLMKNIREEKGFTYGIHSSVTSLDLSGYKVISAEMSKKSTQKAIDEIYKEIRILQTEPVKYEELEVVRNYMAGEMVRMFDGPFAMAESFKAIWEFDLDVDYYDRLADTIRSITSEEIMQIANTYYKIDELYEIIAG